MTPRTTPILLKALGPVLRRDPGQVQLGTELDRAVVVEGLDEEQTAALELLDGTHDLPAALRTGTGGRLVDLLVGRGLLVDAAIPPDLPPATRSLLAPDVQALVRTTRSRAQAYAALERRRAYAVLVVGRGTLPASVATHLRGAGLARVSSGPQAADDWEAAAAESRDVEPPALVVLLGSHALDTSVAHPWCARGIPVLPVVLHGTEAVVGPLVVPGGPCLRCLDLTRADLDPAWPRLLGQLTRPAVGAGEEVSGETSLVAVAAAMSAMVALAAVDGQPLPLGRSLEVSLPWPGVRQRQWPVHPRCSACSRRVSGRPADAAPTSQARMAG